MFLENLCQNFLICLKKVCFCLIPERNESTLKFVYNNSVDDVVDSEDMSSIPLCVYQKYEGNSDQKENFFSCSSLPN
tara:strand:- start:234 stop:464 length:231 start_codon:yes stop_codon:yes gene_type:complete